MAATITKTQSVPNPVPSGSEVTYTIAYTNATAAPVTAILTDTFGAGFTATSATGPAGSGVDTSVTSAFPIVGPDAVTFLTANVAAGATALFTVTGIVTAASGATVTDNVTDAGTGAAGAAIVQTLVGAASADLAITVSGSNSLGAFGAAALFSAFSNGSATATTPTTASLFGFPGFLPGSGVFGSSGSVSDSHGSRNSRSATFFATVTNNGPSAATNVQAVFKVKEGRITGYNQQTGPAFNLPFSGATGFGSAFGGAFGSGFGGLSGYGGRQSCDPVSFFGVAIGSLAAGDEAVFQIVVSVDAGKKDCLTAAELFAIVYSPTVADPNLANNQASAVVLIRPEEKCKSDKPAKCCKDPKCGKPIRRV